jgi:integrase
MGVKSPVTAKRYAEYAVVFLKLMHSGEYENFNQLPPGTLSDFASQLTHRGNSPSTVRVYAFAAKKYLEWVQSRGVKVTQQNRPELPKRILKQRPVLPTAQFAAYFRQADMDLKEPLRTAVMMLPCCGLRASEIISLKLGDIFKADVKLQNGKTKKTLYLRLIGKGGKQRNVPLMEEGVEILTGYLAGWRKRQKGSWLFPSMSESALGAKHISDRGLRNALQSMREVFGIDFTPHTMRRTYITLLWRRHIDLKVLADIAGHASVQTTINHYIIMEPGDTLEAFHNAGSALTD